MRKKALALLLAAMLLSACGGGQAPSSSSEPVEHEISFGEGYEPSVIDEVVGENGVMLFRQAKGATFTMDYEARSGSAMPAHFGLNFVGSCDTNWLGDEGLQARYDLNEFGSDVYGSVVITTAPENPAEYYQTDDESVIKETMAAEFLNTEDTYELRRGEIEEKGYEIVKEGYGRAFANLKSWHAYYIEFVDTDNGNRSMRLFLCNDDISEKYYSMDISVDVPQDNTELIDKFRTILFTLHPITG